MKNLVFVLVLCLFTSFTQFTATAQLNKNPLPAGAYVEMVGRTDNDWSKSITVARDGEMYISGMSHNGIDKDGFVCRINDTCVPGGLTIFSDVNGNQQAEALAAAIYGPVGLMVVGKANSGTTVNGACASNGATDGWVERRETNALNVPGPCDQYKGTGNDEALDAVIDPDKKRAYVAGTYANGGRQDAYVRRLDDNLVMTAEFVFDATPNLLDEAFSVVVGEDSLVYVSGRTDSDLVSWCASQTYDAGAMPAACFGSEDGTNETDLFVAALKSTAANGMELRWLYQFNHPGHSAGRDVIYFNDAVHGKKLVVVGGVSEDFGNPCAVVNDHFVDGMAMLIDLDASGVFSAVEDNDSYGICGVSESIQAVTFQNGFFYYVGADGGPGVNACLPSAHCPPTGNEDGIIIKASLGLFGGAISTMDYVDDVVVEGVLTDGADRLYDVLHDGTNVNVVGQTASDVLGATVSGASDAVFVRFPY